METEHWVEFLGVLVATLWGIGGAYYKMSSGLLIIGITIGAIIAIIGICYDINNKNRDKIKKKEIERKYHPLIDLIIEPYIRQSKDGLFISDDTLRSITDNTHHAKFIIANKHPSDSAEYLEILIDGENEKIERSNLEKNDEWEWEGHLPPIRKLVLDCDKIFKDGGDHKIEIIYQSRGICDYKTSGVVSTLIDKKNNGRHWSLKPPEYYRKEDDKWLNIKK